MGLMGRMARKDATTELASFLSRRAVAELPANAPFLWNALACCAFIRRVVRYQTEDPETFTSLRALLWLGAGDCDDMCIALAALLLRAGWPVRWAVGSNDQGAHVWVQTRPPGAHGAWVDCDPSTYRVEPGTSPLVLGELTTANAYDLDGSEVEVLR